LRSLPGYTIWVFIAVIILWGKVFEFLKEKSKPSILNGQHISFIEK